MKTISFCTTCKGRLWQLEQTLVKNVSILDKGCELVILDYQSPDGLKEHLEENYKEYLEDGRIKYFKLLNNYNFNCAYAKNVVHRLATGDVLFSLDADGFITESLKAELRNLSDNEILVPRYFGNDEGTYGRLGYTKTRFNVMNGYSEFIVAMQDDDGNMRYRAIMAGVKSVHAKEKHVAIQNSTEQKLLYTDVADLTNPVIGWPARWGVADIETRDGVLMHLN